MKLFRDTFIRMPSFKVGGLKAWAIATAAAVCFSAPVMSADADNKKKMVGYAAGWKSIDAIDYDSLTHVIYSFALPNPSGTIGALSGSESTKLETLVQRAHAKNVKVLLAIGGWNGGNDSAWESFSQTSTGVNNFVNDSIYLVNKYNLDGIDLDWEYPDAKWKWNNVVRAIGPALHAKGKLLTAAVAAYGSGADGVGELDQLDLLNVMMYECHCGAEEAPWWQMEDSLKYWQGRGVGADKLMIGIPYYGGGGQDVEFHKRKAAHARDHAAGIMIWELSTDTTNMTLAVASVLWGDSGTGNKEQCDAWSSTGNYNTGDLVKFEGAVYQASNPNPGYIPNVSTWFWNVADSSLCESDVVIPELAEWVAGKEYPKGSQVIYKGAVYTALNDNPGYIPDVSTWYWAQEYVVETCATWNASNQYQVGDKVQHNSSYFEAVKALLPNASDWYWAKASTCD